MSSTKLRQQIKTTVDRLPSDRLASLADYVQFLDRMTLPERVKRAEKAIAAGKGVNWRKVRADV